MNNDELLYILRNNPTNVIRYSDDNQANTCTICGQTISKGHIRYVVLDCPGGIRWVVCVYCYEFATTSNLYLDRSFVNEMRKNIDDFKKRIGL